MENDTIDHDRLTALLALPLASEDPVVSLYVTSGSNGTERRVVVKNLAKQGEEAIRRDTGFDDERRKQAETALERALAAADDAFGRGQPKGTFVVFAWKDRTESFRVPLPLRDRVVVDRIPYTSPLSTVLEQYERYGVCVVDHKAGRIQDYFLGVQTELETVKDASEQKIARAGWHGLEQARMNHHLDYTLHRHLQHVATRIYAQHKHRGFDKLVLAGLPETIAKLERLLHPQLRGRVVGREQWDHDLPRDEIKSRMLEIERSIDGTKERKLLALLRDHVCGDLLATTGYDETLRALYYGKVATLVVGDGGPDLPGRECPECRFLLPRPEDAREKTATLVPCPLCKRPTRSVPDIVNEAAELAMTSGAKVERIFHAKDDLASLGGMASILRFR